MLATVKSATPYGIEGLACEVEVDLAPGLPKVVTVGLPDTAVRESQDRVRAAGRLPAIPQPGYARRRLCRRLTFHPLRP